VIVYDGFCLSRWAFWDFEGFFILLFAPEFGGTAACEKPLLQSRFCF